MPFPPSGFPPALDISSGMTVGKLYRYNRHDFIPTKSSYWLFYKQRREKEWISADILFEAMADAELESD